MQKRHIAVVGSGVSGLSAAWLLSQSHNVTLFEADQRFGGHAHTENFGGTAIDVGFIVFNEKAYPNLTALLRHLEVATTETEMGFAVSLAGGRFEYSGGNLAQLLGSPRAALSRSHWAMLSDLARFYRCAKALSKTLSEDVSLGEFLNQHNFSKPFIERHLIPMAAAIWSSHPEQMLAYPAKAFIEFFENHQLLEWGRREKWQTVSGGSMTYVKKLIANGLQLRSGDAVVNVKRGDGVTLLRCASGHEKKFDHVVLATHADQALAILDQPSADERALLSPFHYSNNEVVVHRDQKLMPKRKRLWSSWNYVGGDKPDKCGVTYWMNSLQNLASKTQYFVSLNPPKAPDENLTEMRINCTHPIFSTATLRAQKNLWSLQGVQNTWFCGAYFGAGFHEDGLQAGLAVAEQLGGVQRPWVTQNPSGRIFVDAPARHLKAAE